MRFYAIELRFAAVTIRVLSSAALAAATQWPRAQSGLTALLSAAEKGHADCVRLLLGAGADANAKGVWVRLM